MSEQCEIVATGWAYPSERVDNATYLSRCRFTLPDPAQLAVETRVSARMWCAPDENTWTLARAATDSALASAPELRDEIDLVVVASGTTMPVLHPPDADNPGMADLAPLVIRHLQRDGVLGLDVKACYCTGFLRGLQVADAIVLRSGLRAALVIASEQGSRFAVAETNRSTFCFIMADAAGAVVIRRGPRAERRGILDHVGSTDASRFDWVGIGPDAASTVMRGTRAAAATHEMLVSAARTVLARNHVTAADVDWLLPIQTHAGVVEEMRAALQWPASKLLWFGDVTGFSGSASIPACLAEQRARGTVRPGDLVLSVAVGAGMNGAAALFHA
jgi:3-oxoacyl-[acyl-carrier-protein] synthase-3